MAAVRIARFESRCPDCKALLYVQGEQTAHTFKPRHVMHAVPACLAYARANKRLEDGGRDPQTLIYLQGCIKNIRGKMLEPAGLDG